MDLNAHNVRKITAEVANANDTTWIELTVHERCRQSKADATCVTLFIAGPNAKRKAEAYAAAINNVNALYPDPELDALLERVQEAMA